MKYMNYTLCKLVGAASLALALALTGCGQASTGAATEETTETEATTEEAATEETAADAVVLPEGMEESSTAVRSVMTATDSLETTDLDELTTDDNKDLEIETTDTVEEGVGDESKAGSGLMLVTCGGMEVQVPQTWQIKRTSIGFDMASPDGLVGVVLEQVAKEAGYTYDVTAMSSAMPSILAQGGFTNIQVVQHDNLYSNTGKLVSSYVLMTLSIENYDCVAYYEYLESKNYITGLYLMTDMEGWTANNSDILTIINNTAFASGEAI